MEAWHTAARAGRKACCAARACARGSGQTYCRPPRVVEAPSVSVVTTSIQRALPLGVHPSIVPSVHKLWGAPSRRTRECFFFPRGLGCGRPALCPGSATWANGWRSRRSRVPVEWSACGGSRDVVELDHRLGLCEANLGASEADGPRRCACSERRVHRASTYSGPRLSSRGTTHEHHPEHRWGGPDMSTTA